MVAVADGDGVGFLVGLQNETLCNHVAGVAALGGQLAAVAGGVHVVGHAILNQLEVDTLVVGVEADLSESVLLQAGSQRLAADTGGHGALVVLVGQRANGGVFLDLEAGDFHDLDRHMALSVDLGVFKQPAVGGVVHVGVDIKRTLFIHFGHFGSDLGRVCLSA